MLPWVYSRGAEREGRMLHSHWGRPTTACTRPSGSFSEGQSDWRRERLSRTDREGGWADREAGCWLRPATGHSGHRIPATSLEGTSADSPRFDRDLYRDRCEDRYAEGSTRGSA